MATPPSQPRGGPPEPPSSDRPAGIRRGSVSLGRWFGIRVEAHFSVLIIFALIFFSLGAGTFPAWHPDWSMPLVWTLALATALLFFLSLLMHELAHSVVARMRGIPIDRITLFLFGGVSEMKQEPQSPGTEFIVAIVGPLMSVAIGVGSILLAALFLPADIMDRLATDPGAAFATLGPLPTLLLWLGPINLFLAAFNMVPGFPLDGGRVLRSILWAVTGDLRKATRWAANAGKGVAFLLMALGGFAIFSGAFIDGLWLLFLAWFLYSAARGAYGQMVVRQSLKGLTVRDIMDTGFQTVDADTDLDTFVHENLAHSSQPVWPVTRDGSIIGVVAVQEIAAVPREQRPHVNVERVSLPVSGLPTVGADDSGLDAMGALETSGVALVVDNGEVTGLLTHSGVTRWLNLFADDARSGLGV